MFSSLFSFSLSHLLSPLFKPKHHPPPNINITRHSGGNVDAMIDTSRFHNFFFPCCDAMILANRSWPRLINNGGKIDLAAAMAMMSGFLIGVDLGFFFFFFPCCDAMILVDWGWSRLINDGGNVDLTAVVAVVSRFFFFFLPVVIGVDWRCLGFCSKGILVGSGGVVGMVEVWWWWLGNGGIVLEVEGACELMSSGGVCGGV